MAEVFEVPSSLQFVRDYVAKNVPVVIRNATLDWPAVSKWNSKYFRCVYGVGDERLFTNFMYILIIIHTVSCCAIFRLILAALLDFYVVSV